MFISHPLFRRIEKGHRADENVYSASGQTEPVDFEVDLESEVTYYALDKKLSQMLSEVAEERGVSAETLLNLGVQEKLWKHTPPEAA